jgi:hypothetical protein
MIDILYSLKGQYVTLCPYNEKFDEVFGQLIESTQDGVMIKGIEDNKSFVEYYPWSSVTSIRRLDDQSLSLSPGIVVVDSLDTQIRSILKKKIDGETEYEYDEDDNTITVDLEGDTILEGDRDEIVVHSEAAMEAAKELAKVIGCKKVIRDIREEE